MLECSVACSLTQPIHALQAQLLETVELKVVLAFYDLTKTRLFLLILPRNVKMLLLL